MTLRRVLLAAGALVTAAGLALAVVPDPVADRPVPTAWFALVGVLAGAAGLAVVVDRLRPADATRPPARPAVRVPGESFDRRLADLSARDDEAVAALREELRAVAVAALVRRGNSPREARRLVERGDWTDDGEAAAFLAEEADPTSRAGWFRTLATGEPRAARRARRVVDAVVRVAEGAD